MRPSRRNPLIRGFVGASVATFVALASHVWAGDPVPGVLGIAVPWVLSLMVCVLLAGRRLSLVRLSVSVLISQLLFHALFVLGTVRPAGSRVALAPHVHGAPLDLTAGAAVLLPATGGMWGAHGAAAIATVVLLHRGERIVLALLRAASGILAWLRRIVRTGPPVRIAAPAGARWPTVPAPVRRDPLLSTHRLRGPPLLLV